MATMRMVASVLLALTACTPAMPPEDATPRDRYEWSVDRFNAGKYHDAIRGFRSHLLQDPLHPTADSARFFLAESHLRTGDRFVAANEFQRLANTRPNSPLADDAQYGACRAYWEASPKLPLDQQNTRRTVEECTRLIEFFPRSGLVQEARGMITLAREKMAAREVRIVASFYHRSRMYESEVIVLEGVLASYPDTRVIPEALAMLHESYSVLGFLAEAEAARRILLDSYPDSPEAKKLAGSNG